jgi:hypothetical protein
LGKGDLKLYKKWQGPLQRGDNHTNAKIGLGHLKIFLRTTEPEELIFTCKVQVCSNHGPWGSLGTTIEENIYISLY